ncbi:MAG TPA: TetR/AcrR family transcriptional regulator [Acidimicrobiales bacterium]
MPVDNRAALLKGARQCLEQIGYARTTTRDVANAAGVSLGAIGYHFGSKEVLLNEAIAEGFRDWIASFAPLVIDSEGAGLDARLRQAIPQFYALMENNRPLLVAFFEALAQAEHTPALRAQFAEQYRQSRAAAAEMLTTSLGPQLAEIGIDPETLGSLILALVDGLITQYLIDPDDTPSASALLAFYDVLVSSSTKEVE